MDKNVVLNFISAPQVFNRQQNSYNERVDKVYSSIIFMRHSIGFSIRVQRVVELLDCQAIRLNLEILLPEQHEWKLKKKEENNENCNLTGKSIIVIYIIPFSRFIIWLTRWHQLWWTRGDVNMFGYFNYWFEWISEWMCQHWISSSHDSMHIRLDFIWMKHVHFLLPFENYEAFSHFFSSRTLYIFKP